MQTHNLQARSTVGGTTVLISSGAMHRKEDAEMEIGMAIQDFVKKYNCWRDGQCKIQDAFPKLSADEREFIMTGMTPAEWDEMMKEPEETI